jgi:dTDP-4-amino-4,6-dideoxygalactose transaminase
VSVINVIKQAGFKPVYADIDKSLNTPLDSIKKVYSPATKAIIVQHTFGNPAEIDEIVRFAHNHNLLVIEDCAHALGASI